MEKLSKREQKAIERAMVFLEKHEHYHCCSALDDALGRQGVFSYKLVRKFGQFYKRDTGTVWFPLGPHTKYKEQRILLLALFLEANS